jgi:transposase
MINYEHDFYGWTQEQAALLRSGRLTELDTIHLLEEVEDMSGSKRRELKNRLAVLIAHLLKWLYQPGRRGHSWSLTIDEQRQEIADVIQENPGLKPEIAEQLRKAYRIAILQAAKETGFAKKVFPETCPWEFEMIIDDEFFPD